jgi:hypothetical protein
VVAGVVGHDRIPRGQLGVDLYGFKITARILASESLMIANVLSPCCVLFTI